MKHWMSAAVLGFWSLSAAIAEATYQDFDQPPHRYHERTPADRFTRLKASLESGALVLDRAGEKAFLAGLLKALEIPASSQMLVFSTTSLQLSLIGPSSPRALYFNEDTYLGYIPGGRIEIVSLDPDLGGIFYIFDIPRDAAPVRAERSKRCMNCHAGEDTGFLPGLVVRSVAPGPTGGSLDSFRRGQTGHGIPFEERFGGWYVTGSGNLTNHWGNLIGELSGGVLTKTPNPPGSRFSYGRYLVATSDLLPQLVHEHQVGFVDRAIEAGYRARTYLHQDVGALTRGHQDELDRQARILTRYLLFLDEVPLPAGGIVGDPAFKAEFSATRREVDGASLKDFDLRTRLFRHRCSYMIDSVVFQGLPPMLRQKVYQQIGQALSEDPEAPGSVAFPVEEKRTIRRILRKTFADLPAGW